MIYLNIDNGPIEGYKSFSVEVDNVMVNFGLMKTGELADVLKDLQSEVEQEREALKAKV